MVQEYVDHGGRVWKVYVAGDQARCAAAETLCRDALWPICAVRDMVAWMLVGGHLLRLRLPRPVLPHTGNGADCKETVTCPHALQVYWSERKSTPDLRGLTEQLAADPEAGKACSAECRARLPASFFAQLRASHAVRRASAPLHGYHQAEFTLPCANSHLQTCQTASASIASSRCPPRCPGCASSRRRRAAAAQMHPQYPQRNQQQLMGCRRCLARWPLSCGGPHLRRWPLCCASGWGSPCLGSTSCSTAWQVGHGAGGWYTASCAISGCYSPAMHRLHHSSPLVLGCHAGELVIIDVNYFPSFKGVPEAPAALRAALRQRYAAAVGAH